jgi:hypothetical protein
MPEIFNTEKRFENLKYIHVYMFNTEQNNVAKIVK